MRVDDHAVREALVRIDSHVVQTPIFRNDTLDQRLGLRLSLKGEHLQPVGSFKVRGAANMVLSQSPDALIAGVCTHSSGNHGAALAWTEPPLSPPSSAQSISKAGEALGRPWPVSSS